MSNDSDGGKHEKDGRESVSPAAPRRDGAEEAQIGGHPGQPPNGEPGSLNEPFWRDLDIREWVTVGAAVAAALAAVASGIIAYWTYGELDAQRVAMEAQLHEMQSGAQDTKNLVTATRALADAGGQQATAMNSLAYAGQSQAANMDKLRIAGEAQAKATGEQATSIQSEAAITKQSLDVAKTTLSLGQRARVGPTQAAFESPPTIDQPLKIAITYGNFGRDPASGYVRDVKAWAFTNEQWNDGYASNAIETYSKTDCAKLVPSSNGDVVYPSQFQNYQAHAQWDKKAIGIAQIISGELHVAFTGCFAYVTLSAVHHTASCFWWHGKDASGDIPTGNLPHCDFGQHSD